MDRYEFIITIYWLVCEYYQVSKNISPLHRGGVASARSDEAVLAMELCGKDFKLTI